jgi:flagellar FliL protein
MKVCTKYLSGLCLLLGLGGSSVWALAQEADASSDTAPASVSTTYIPLAPPFVVNYGGKGRLKYLKAEMSVRVDDMESANSVRHHMPLIRNNLVMLFSRQSEEDVSTQEGKERLRKTALQEINDLITAEDGKSGVVDVYFNNLIIQQ